MERPAVAPAVHAILDLRPDLVEVEAGDDGEEERRSGSSRPHRWTCAIQRGQSESLWMHSARKAKMASRARRTAGLRAGAQSQGTSAIEYHE